ncbi:hypothetical protein M9H77_28418 [Catharanthus roseus]|uniref:Uncharacterized protein n=1 Tax=Catharanthus roseus TaxID=4058 RepID=A0ACC0AGY2_CATRO|nr:hypothetical protein M9H77_28418 [Catharanthus roseus]
MNYLYQPLIKKSSQLEAVLETSPNALGILVIGPMDCVVSLSNNPNNLSNLSKLADQDSSHCDKDTSMNMLSVRVVKGENGITFEDGWEKFRDDNNLSPSEVLLFCYSGNWIFDVEIFSPNGYRRKLEDTDEEGTPDTNEEGNART